MVLASRGDLALTGKSRGHAFESRQLHGGGRRCGGPGIPCEALLRRRATGYPPSSCAWFWSTSALSSRPPCGMPMRRSSVFRCPPGSRSSWEAPPASPRECPPRISTRGAGGSVHPGARGGGGGRPGGVRRGGPVGKAQAQPGERPLAPAPLCGRPQGGRGAVERLGEVPGLRSASSEPIPDAPQQPLPRKAGSPRPRRSLKSTVPERLHPACSTGRRQISSR